MSEDDVPDPKSGPLAALRWFWHTDREHAVYAREFLKSAGTVALLGLVLFLVSGIWPPMVAVESGSMEPQMERGDLVFVMEEHRFSGDGVVEGTGVVPYQNGKQTGYTEFNDYGDVIIYSQPGHRKPPIIHRAMFWVESGENWYDDANEEYLRAESCSELQHCPAPHAGFITKGDNNPYYDQETFAKPVKPSWIRGTAELKIPWLGNIRLALSSLVLSKDLLLAGVGGSLGFVGLLGRESTN